MSKSNDVSTPEMFNGDFDSHRQPDDGPNILSEIVRQEIVSTSTIDHILCTHNLDSAAGIASILNDIAPDSIGFEMPADEATRNHHRTIIQAIVDGNIDRMTVLANVSPRDPFHKVAALLDLTGVTIFTPDTINPDFKRIPGPDDTVVDMLWDRGTQNITREETMLAGVLQQLYTTRQLNQKIALVTGGLHTYPSTELKRLGATVNRHYVMDYEAMGLKEENPLGTANIYYPSILAAQRAVRYGFADKAKLAQHFLND